MSGRPPHMAAVVLMGHGGFEQYAYREDVPVPTPGHGEVLVAVEAAGLNNTDVNVRTDWYGGEVDETGLRFPRIQGADVAGRVIELGDGVERSLAGRRVIVNPSLGSGLLGFDADGGFARYVVVPAACAWSVAEHLPAEELAAYPVAYSTALEMIVRSRAQPGETMVVTGASGGVGCALVQLGKVYELNVIAICSAAKAARVRDLGADVVIDRVVLSVRDALREASVDVVADVVGGEQLAELVSILRPGGRCVVAGAIGGPIAPIDLRHLIYKDIELSGVAQTRSTTFPQLVELIRDGRVSAPVAATYPLRELAAAQRAFIAKDFVGKVVLSVGD